MSNKQPEKSVEEIQYPNKKGKGCKLDCGVSFIHYHLNGDIKKPIPYNPTTEPKDRSVKETESWYDNFMKREGRKPDKEDIIAFLTQTLTAERQKRDEVVELEREYVNAYATFVDEMSVDTPFQLAFEALNDRLSKIIDTPPTYEPKTSN